MNKPYVGAMRIYIKDERKLVADLAILKNGYLDKIETINYDDIDVRESYYINAYTLIWDERIIPGTFSVYVSKFFN